MEKQTRQAMTWCGGAQALVLTLSWTVAATAQRVPPRALPVEEPAPVKAQPVEPAPVKAQPVTDPNRPTGPDEDLYDYAMLCWSQNDYKIALKPFSDYVKTYPQGRHAAEAWFRLGECYRQLKALDDATRAYNEVITRFPRSESAASAAYRLGSFAYTARDFIKGVGYFEITERLSTVVDIRTAATFNKALCLKYAGQKEKALAAFKVVAISKNPSMFREIDIAQQEVAALATDLGRKEEALEAYQRILITTKDPKLLGDALLRSGLLLNDLGKAEEAMKNFRRALATPDLPAEQKGIAVFGLIQGNFVKGDYDAVIETYTANASVLPPADLQAKQLLIVGTAYKNKQLYRQAIEVFLLLEKNHPNAPEAIDAGYQKLLCFFQLNDQDLPLFTERFEERYSAKHPGHEYLQMARLIRADWWFGKGDYAKAAEAFSGVDVKRVPEKVRASVVYKKGFAEAEAGKATDAISTLTLFLTDYPKDANVPVALAQRGLSHKAVRAFDRALEDFGSIVKDYNGHPAVEMALYQGGLIKAELRDTPGMIADLEALVKRFPSSAAAAEAWYRIGRGYFDLQQKEMYAKALDPLHKAIVLDSKTWLDKASQLLISCQYLREDVDGLAKEVDAYLAARKDAAISPKALLFLGVKYYERENFRSSARYLALASTPDAPQNTEALVWNYLGQAELKNGSHEAAVKALDNYLAQTPGGGGRASALISKGLALLALGRFDEADQCAEEGLQMVKEGRLHAQLQLLHGDIAMAHGNALAAAGDDTKAMEEWKKAAGNYVVVSQIFVDPEITPEAADKAASALDKIGEKAKAEALRKQLQSKYPNYQAKQ